QAGQPCQQAREALRGAAARENETAGRGGHDERRAEVGARIRSSDSSHGTSLQARTSLYVERGWPSMGGFCRTLTTWFPRRGKCAPQHQELQKVRERSRAGIARLCKSAPVLRARAGCARYDFRRGKCMSSNNN